MEGLSILVDILTISIDIVLIVWILRRRKR